MSITQPRTAGFVSRAAWGARRPRSTSRNISPGNGGVALHYGGANVPVSNHSQCVSRWKGWQDYHMNTHGWADIAYSMGVCQHGYVFAGRGAGVRTAANGTNHGNNTHYAVCWIGGERQTPSAAALSAFAWAINELRRTGGAGRSVKPHRFFKSTGCPGNPLVSAARQVDGKTIGGGGSTPKPPPKPEPELDDWEVFWMELSSKEREFLKGYAQYYVGEGVGGRSMALQNLENHRNRIPRLTEFVDNFERLIKAGGTSLQGVVIGGINAIDAVRDMGYKIGTGSRHGVRKS